MSLFGGEGTISQPPSPSSSAEEFLSEHSASPQSAQAPPLHVPDIDDSEDEDFRPNSPDAIEQELALSSPNAHDEDLQPNPPATEAAPSRDAAIIPQSSWRRHTLADREIATSLDDIEYADLAAHLFNAHHQKRRLRRPDEYLKSIKDWQSKETWFKKGEDLQYVDPLTGELETELIPWRWWSAWPFSPHRMRRMNAYTMRHGIDDGEEGWYIDSSTDYDGGEVMRDEVLALFLRTAKEQWMARHADDGDLDHDASSSEHSDTSSSDQDSDIEMIEEVVVDDGDMDHDAASSEHSSTSSSDQDTDIEVIEVVVVDSSEAEGEQSACDIGGLEVDTENERSVGVENDSDLECIGEGLPSSSRPEQPDAEATFLADDDVARRILDPSINSILSRLDGLMLAVRRNRSNHVGDRARGRSSSASDYLTDGETPAPRSRSSSRSQSREPRRKKSSQPSTPKKSSKQASKRKEDVRTSQSRDLVSAVDAHMRSEDEEPPNLRGGPPKRRARSSSTASIGGSSTSSNSQVRRETGLMDWSELLGIAAISGWDKNVVARTAQRCASLFGEQMGFRTFDEGQAAHSIPDLVQYTPATIVSPNETDLDSASVPKRPYYILGSLRCPHQDCPGSLKGFGGSNRLVQHVQRKHGYDPRTNDSDNEERTVGGVHIDGYLQPVWARPGWFGNGRARSEGEETKPTTPRRKRQKVQPQPASTVPSAYTTKVEQETEEEEEEELPQQVAPTRASRTPTVVPERVKNGKACARCSRKKVRCDGGRPCERCSKSGEQDTCVDREEEAPQRAAPKRQRLKAGKTCTNCSRKKKPCDGGRPCERCRKSGEQDTCTDRAVAAPSRRPCSNCKRSKRKCDYDEPCERCERLGMGDTCEYPV